MRKVKTTSGATIYLDDIQPIAVRFRGKIAVFIGSLTSTQFKLTKRLRGAPKRYLSLQQSMAVLAAIQTI